MYSKEEICLGSWHIPCVYSKNVILDIRNVLLRIHVDQRLVSYDH